MNWLLGNARQAAAEVFGVLFNRRQQQEKGQAAGRDVGTTVIGASTKVAGNIVTDADLEIAGIVEGNVETRNNLLVGGEIRGEVKCRDAKLQKAEIEGNVTVAETLVVEPGSVVTGNVIATNAMIAGEIKGDLIVRLNASISKQAMIIGDISANTISIESGAVIQGGVSIRNEAVGFAASKAESSKLCPFTVPGRLLTIAVMLVCLEIDCPHDLAPQAQSWLLSIPYRSILVFSIVPVRQVAHPWNRCIGWPHQSNSVGGSFSSRGHLWGSFVTIYTHSNLVI